MNKLQNVLDIIHISPQIHKFQKTIFECNFCKEHHSTFLLYPYAIKISKIFICTKCKEFYCMYCIVHSSYCNEKLTMCNNCLPRCHVENCQNKSLEFCLNCRRPLCSEHVRNKNMFRNCYCHQKKSLECARYVKQNKK